MKYDRTNVNLNSTEPENPQTNEDFLFIHIYIQLMTENAP